MKTTLFFTIFLFILSSCSKNSENEYSLPDNIEAGKIYNLETTVLEDSGLKITEGILVVTENRESSDSRLLELPLKIFKSTSLNPLEPVFWLTGGPGSSNMDYQPDDELLAQHDVVLVGYRGADGNTALLCPEIFDETFQHNMFSEEAVAAMQSNLCDCKDQWIQSGVDLASYSMTDVIDDFETARQALNYGKINLLSVSYGTRLAQIFANRYPESIHRSLMVSVNPPGHFVWRPETLDQQIQYYSELWAKDSVYSQKSDDLAACIKRVMNNMPERWLFFKIDPDKVRFSTFMGLYYTNFAGSVFDAFVAADKGDASGLALVSFMAGMQLKSMASAPWGDTFSKSFSDYNPAVDYQKEMGLNSYIIGSPGSQLFAASAVWQIPSKDTLYSSVHYSETETLMLSGNIDLSTPAEFAKEELLPYLKNGKQYILSDYGHVGDIMTRERDAFLKALTSFYSTGIADMSAYSNKKVDFTPEMSFPKLAKIALSVAFGVLLLIVGIGFLIRYTIKRRRKKRSLLHTAMTD